MFEENGSIVDYDFEKIKYYSRSNYDDHESSLRNDSEISTDCNAILDHTFWHIPAFFNLEKPMSVNKTEPSIEDEVRDFKLLSRDWLSWVFFNEDHYVPPTIKKDIDGKEKKLSEFIQGTITKRGIGLRNNLFFLAGDVGVGKTCLINHLLTTKGDEIYKNNTWFLRYNIDVHNNEEGPLDFRTVIIGLSKKLVRIIRDLKTFEKNNSASDDLNDEADKLEAFLNPTKIGKKASPKIRTAFASSVSAVSKILDKRFCLILDNLDYAFHTDDRGIFLYDQRDRTDDEIRNVHEIVNEFYFGDTSLSRLNANVIFVLRYESYVYLENTKLVYSATLDPYQNRRGMYTLTPPHWIEIIKQRTYFLEKYIIELKSLNSNHGKCIQLEKMLKPMLNALKQQVSAYSSNKNITLSALEKLTNQGMRDFLSFFKNYAWITTWAKDSGDPVLLRRYLDQKHIALIMYMMGGKAKFSQFPAKFPNMFVANAAGSGDATITVSQDNKTVLLSTSNEHSYWLKFLILKFIENKDGEATNLRDVLDEFCGIDSFNYEGKRVPGYFPEIVVRMVLGSFAQRASSNLILPERVVIQKRIKIQNIALTARGKYLLNSLMWKFPYLQLIVDDGFLRIPSCLKNDFSFKNTINYKYLVKDESTFSSQGRVMIRHKFEWVCKFLAILKVEQELDMLRYGNALEGLKGYNVRLPDINKIISDFSDEMKALSRHIEFGISSHEVQTETQNQIRVYEKRYKSKIPIR